MFLRRLFGKNTPNTDRDAIAKASPLSSRGEPSEQPSTAVMTKREFGSWDGMVAPAKFERNSLGAPHALIKWGMSAWAIVGISIIIIGITMMLGAVSEVFLGVFLAFVLTSVLLPVVDWLDKFMPRALATALSVIGGFIVLGGLASYIVFSVVNEWDELAGKFEQGIDDIIGFITDGPLPIDVEYSDVVTGMENAVDSGVEYVRENAGNIAQMVASNAGQLAVIVTILALAVFVTVCLLTSGKDMWLWFLNLLPARLRERTNLGAYAGWVAFSGYAAGTVIIAIINGILAFAFLFLIGIPLAAPLAVLVMIGTFIPLVGAPAAMIIAMIVALASHGVIMFVVVGLGIALIGQLEGNLFQPLIMGKQVSVHPALVAVGVAAGGFAAGLVGAVIAIPIMAVVWAVFRTLYVPDQKLEKLPDVPKERVLPDDED